MLLRYLIPLSLLLSSVTALPMPSPRHHPSWGMLPPRAHTHRIQHHSLPPNDPELDLKHQEETIIDVSEELDYTLDVGSQ
ncbi:hypothetical protein BZA70DRAFT_282709 [Myxozyma melibiosi]|uniref:Uncharacterized protein n=1 Tax=Myxozyma melibiosi TaxID=54550 RepID=A0ABR1F128_9ASCO